MKKIVIIIMILLLAGCSNEKAELNENKNTSDVPIKENTSLPSNTYEDHNPVKVSIYIDNEQGSLLKVIDKYETTWEKKKDIVVLATLPTDIDNPEYGYMSEIWPLYDKYDMSYKIGWSVSFKLKNGEEINSTLLKPSDAESYYDYLEIYLYDDVNVPAGQWHSHLLDDEINEKTIMDAIKLTAGEKYEEIDGPISVMVFSYDDNEDFDGNGNYRGKSLYKVEIYNN